MYLFLGHDSLWLYKESTQEYVYVTIEAPKAGRGLNGTQIKF